MSNPNDPRDYTKAFEIQLNSRRSIICSYPDFGNYCIVEVHGVILGPHKDEQKAAFGWVEVGPLTLDEYKEIMGFEDRSFVLYMLDPICTSQIPSEDIYTENVKDNLPGFWNEALNHPWNIKK